MNTMSYEWRMKPPWLGQLTAVYEFEVVWMVVNGVSLLTYK